MDAEILQLFRADCAEARGVNPGAPEYVALRSRDARRVARVMELLATGDPRSAEALHAAAWILNHGETAEEVRLGHGLALKALAAGHEPARWLAAATLDRSLMYEGKPQRYGTNMVPDGRRIRVWDVDPSTTDEERARWNVPPLAEMERRAAEASNGLMPPMDHAPPWLRAALERWAKES